MTLVVMAAGRGSRFGGMKQVAEVGPSGESLFDYAVFDALRSGFDDVVFVVSEASADAVRHSAEGGCARHAPVRYALQAAAGRDKPWGTGHAVLTACAGIEGPFVVVNADDFYGFEAISSLGQELSEDHGDHVLVAYRLRDSLSANGGVSRGVCTVEDGVLTSITELHGLAGENGTVRSGDGVVLTGDELISTNLWGFQPSFHRAVHEEFEAFLARHGENPDAEFRIGDAVASLPRYGAEKVRVVPTSERFLGVTFAEDLAGVRAEIAALVEAGRYPARLWGDRPRRAGRGRARDD